MNTIFLFRFQFFWSKVVARFHIKWFSVSNRKKPHIYNIFMFVCVFCRRTACIQKTLVRIKGKINSVTKHASILIGGKDFDGIFRDTEPVCIPASVPHLPYIANMMLFTIAVKGFLLPIWDNTPDLSYFPLQRRG